MSLGRRIADDLRAAMKAGDRPRVDCLRMLRARLLEHEVAQRPTRGAGAETPDSEVERVIAAYAKQRRESIAEFRRGGRDDLASREEAELAIVQSYLPEPLGDEQVREVVRAVIAELGASSPRDLGAVMKSALPRLEGRADGGLVSRIARELLAPAAL